MHHASNRASHRLRHIAIVLLGAWLTMGTLPAIAGEQFVFVGTYTRGTKSEGIYVYRLNDETGELKAVSVGKGVDNPSFLAVHPSGKFLYAVGETETYRGKSGAVTAFSLDPQSGELRILNDQSSEGTGPCHIAVDRAGKSALVANYGSGSVASLAIGDDGKLAKAASAIQHKGSSVDPRRQEGPHAHSINLDPANRFACAADLGLDQVLVYRFDSSQSTIIPNVPAATKVAGGSGPRHFAFHPGGKFAYVINEMNCTVTAFRYDADHGVLTEMQTITTLPIPFQPGFSTAEVQVHPSGKFLYGSNRGHDSIAIFKIDPASGKLAVVGHQSTQGKTPRNFGIDPTGAFLLAANQSSDSIVIFRIDADTGKLTATGNTVSVPAPVCVKFLQIR